MQWRGCSGGRRRYDRSPDEYDWTREEPKNVTEKHLFKIIWLTAYYVACFLTFRFDAQQQFFFPIFILF